MLKKFNMSYAKPMKTLMHTDEAFVKDENDMKVDQIIYRGMIGSLLYITSNKVDISHIVYLCARCQSYPKEFHLRVVKKIFGYLLRFKTLCLCFNKNDSFKLEGFCNTNYVGDRVERKSTCGGCQFL